MPRTHYLLAALLFTPADITDILNRLGQCLVSLSDSGPPSVDGGAADAGALDAGLDAGKTDGGKRDAGPLDANSPVPADAAAATGYWQVSGSALLDPNGVQFIPRGTNKTHQDFWAQGLANTRSNTTRWIVYFTNDAARTLSDLQSPNIGGSTASRALQVPGFWDGTCKSDQALLDTMVARWISWLARSDWQGAQRFIVPNIANEWGSDEVAWRDAYAAALPQLRATGWRGTLLVDAPGCGQNGMAVARYGASVLAADPLHNVAFSWHVYGGVYDSQGGTAKSYDQQVDLVPTMNALTASGLAVLIGEFGPGRNIGPSPTTMTPQRIVEQAEQHGFGWMSWSWDDNDLSNAKCSNDGFCHAYDPTVYAQNSDLTDFGKVMVGLWEQYARPASIFPSNTKHSVAAQRVVVANLPGATSHLSKMRMPGRVH